MDALRTSKWAIFDLGAGIVASAATLATGIFLLRIQTFSDLRNLRTPRSRLLILAICVSAWFLSFCASAYSFFQDLGRHMSPWWADSIAIPLGEIKIFYFDGVIILVSLTWLLALHRAALPTSLWVWRQDAPIASWFFSVCAAVSLLGSAWSFSDVLRFGPYIAVPAIGLWIYGALVVRAAGISCFAPKPSSPQIV
jgi:hypothetical protein